LTGTIQITTASSGGNNGNDKDNGKGAENGGDTSNGQGTNNTLNLMTKDLGSVVDFDSDTAPAESSSNLLVILIVTIGCTVFLSIVILFVCLRRRKLGEGVKLPRKVLE